MKNKKMLIAWVLMIAGWILVMTCGVPASPLQLLMYVGLICVFIGAGIAAKEGIKLKKSRKKEDSEETKKW